MIGLSDHTNGIISSICATSLGVVAIEKHMKLRKMMFRKTVNFQFCSRLEKIKNFMKIFSLAPLKKIKIK